MRFGFQINFITIQEETAKLTPSSGGFLSTPLMMDKPGQLQIFSTGDTPILESILLHQQLIIMVGLQQLLLELILK